MLGLVMFFLYTKAWITFINTHHFIHPLANFYLSTMASCYPMEKDLNLSHCHQDSACVGSTSSDSSQVFLPLFPVLQPSWTFSSSNHLCSFLSQGIHTYYFPSGINSSAYHPSHLHFGVLLYRYQDKSSSVASLPLSVQKPSLHFSKNPITFLLNTWIRL